MELLVCIDDTDTLETKGTGHLAQNLCQQLECRGWGTCAPITRHQLYVHPDIALVRIPAYALYACRHSASPNC